MIDEQFYDLIHGTTESHNTVNSVRRKDRFQIALEEAVKVDIASIYEEDPSCQLIPLQIRQEQLEKEFMEAVDQPDLLQNLVRALEILEKGDHLNEEDHQNLLGEINRVRKRFDTLNLHSLDDTTISNALTISNEVLALILHVAVMKFTEHNFADALAIFALLTTFKGRDPEYWYRLGLAAQQMGLYDLAVRAYQTSSELAPEFVGANIFAAQCYIEMNKANEAVIKLRKAKNNIKIDENLKDEWEEHIIDVEHLLA